MFIYERNRTDNFYTSVIFFQSGDFTSDQESEAKPEMIQITLKNDYRKKAIIWGKASDTL